MPPCRTVKNQNHPRGEANFIKPPSRRAQNLQNWKTRTRISSLHRKLKIFQSPPLGWWIDQNPYPPKSHSRILFNIFRSNVQPSPPHSFLNGTSRSGTHTHKNMILSPPSSWDTHTHLYFDLSPPLSVPPNAIKRVAYRKRVFRYNFVRVKSVMGFKFWWSWGVGGRISKLH